MRLRFTFLVFLVVALTAGVAVAMSRAVESRAALFAATVALALPAALLASRPLLARFVALLGALEEGLLSFFERDFSVRLAVTRDDEIGAVVRRFNALGEQLRSGNNDAYQKEMLLATVLEEAPMAIALCNAERRVVLANAAARDLFLEGKRLEGHSFDELLRQVPAAIAEALASREDAFFTVERAAESQSFHAATRFFEINGQRHTLHLLRPLGRELARQEAETWKRAIRLMSHELNNSLAPIASLTHSGRLVAKAPESGEKLDRIFDTIEERTTHLQGFLEAYARFARLPKPALADASWKALLDGVQPLYSFRLAAEPAHASGRFDPVQMQQVLINLLKNAAESGSAPEEIVVEIATAADGGGALVVRDRGKGMSEETLAKAVLPFYSTKKAGTGLGLSLCREIVEAHGGRLALKLREGGGVEVECRLPGR